MNHTTNQENEMNGQPQTVGTTPEETREIIREANHLNVTIHRVAEVVAKVDERLQSYMRLENKGEQDQTKPSTGVDFADRLSVMKESADKSADRLNSILDRLAL